MVAMVFLFGGMAWTAIGLGFYENCVVADEQGSISEF